MAIRYVDVDEKTGKVIPPKPAEPERPSWRDREAAAKAGKGGKADPSKAGARK